MLVVRARSVVVFVVCSLVVALSGCNGAPEPAAQAHSAAAVTITSCGYSSAVSAPQRAVTLNQGATEVMLSLGLQDRMAGTAYLDDTVADRWQQAYRRVPVLAKNYPSREKFLSAEPDFAYASYASAFEAKAVGTRDELKSSGIGSYLSPFGCPDKDQQPKPSFAAVWDEVHAVARAFGVTDRADAIEADQRKKLNSAADLATGQGQKIFWYDSGDKTPFAGTGGGGPQLIIDAVGADNVFGGVDGGWADVSWEKVIKADPDVIVVADASWSDAHDKIDYLRKDPVLRKLAAVRAERFVVVPFSESTPGVRLADGVAQLSDGLQDLPRS